MITATPNSVLWYWRRKVDQMEPGQCLDVPMDEIREIPSFFHNDATFTPADRILENIMGSAYTHSYSIDPLGRKVTFRCHKNTGDRHYTSPDRR